MATQLKKPVSRQTQRNFGHYGRPIVVTLAPGSEKRDDLIGFRLKGTRQQYVARLSDIFRLAALWHGQKLATAKREARKNGIAWRTAKKTFDATNRI